MFFRKLFSRRIINVVLSFFLTAFLSAANHAFAAPKNTSINFAYCVVDGFIEEENSGVGYELMNAVLTRLQNQGYQVNVSFVPAMRLLNSYIKKQYDMIFPIMKIKNFTLESFQKWGFDHIPLYSRPLYDGGQFVIYSHIDTERINTLHELLEKKVVVIAGAYIPVDLVPPTPYNVEYVETAEQAFKMVLFDRVDAFLVHKGWGESTLERMDTTELHHGEAFEDIRGGFIVQDTPKGETLVHAIDTIIADMIEDGTYAQIMERYPENQLVIHPE